MQKILFFLSICLLFPLTHFAQAGSGVKVMGYELGAASDSLDMKGLLKMGKYQKLARYDVAGESIQLDGIPLKFCKLYFWEGKLHSIDMKAMAEAGDELMLWIISVFGEGEKKDAMGYHFVWILDSIHIDAEQNLVTKDVTVSFVDNLTHRKYFKYMYQRENGQN